jgi:hypothetical protein
MKHKIIQTENYLLIVDDSEIKEGDYYLFTWGGEQDIQRFQNQEEDKIKHQRLYETTCKKIISHLPLNNSPILDSVDLLPPLEDDEVEKLAKQWCLINNYNSEDMIHSNYINYIRVYQLFIQGYNKAKEKYKYTEEDLKKAIKLARGIKEGKDTFTAEDIAGCTEVCTHNWKYEFSDEEIIQSLQQPKMPIEFEYETKIDIQWVGKYIY